MNRKFYIEEKIYINKRYLLMQILKLKLLLKKIIILIKLKMTDIINFKEKYSSLNILNYIYIHLI